MAVAVPKVSKIAKPSAKAAKPSAKALKAHETALMRAIMKALSVHGHAVFRANVGLFLTMDGRYMRSGLPVGFSDIFGSRKGDAKTFFFEVKVEDGKLSPEQIIFLQTMRKRGAIAAVVHSIDEALQAINDAPLANIEHAPWQLVLT